MAFGGDPTAEIDATADPIFDDVSYGTSLTFQDGAESHTLTAFTTSLDVDESGSAITHTFAADGDMTSSEFTGSVAITTTTDFGGELRIFGLSNASIRVQPLDTTNVDLLIDLDGNGSTDALVATTWAALGF